MAPNRLAGSASPYLLQHQDNPVDWWPWSEAAFQEAKRRHVPVFLSVGYATCHWCHVMAHESFEDPEIARLLNDNFVCIKVDREERPDLDDLYMAACQATTGRGGWPLTVLLTPDKRPWFAGTYFPPEMRGHMIGLRELVPRLVVAWNDRREELEQSAEHLVDHIRMRPVQQPGKPKPAWLKRASQALAASFDAENGGFGSAPKFPSTHQLRLLLRRGMRGDSASHEVAIKTLDAMAAGGIHDQVGGGFHRYSTDARWFVPHFEKMLYDQAQMLETYAEAYALTQNVRYLEVCQGIVEYVERDLGKGALWAAAEDADSEGEEGTFYTWPRDELLELLSVDEVDALGATDAGNYHDESSGKATRRNILAGRLEPATRKLLLKHRAKRPRPMRDDKILADWNALFIHALSRAGRLTGNPDWVSRADKAGRAVGRRLWKGGLRHMRRNMDLGEHVFLEDLAAWLKAQMELYGATQDLRWLHGARATADQILRDHRDEDGVLLQCAAGDETLARRRPTIDGALPSANATAMHGLWWLGRVTAEPEYEKAAWRILEALAPLAEQQPVAFTGSLASYFEMLNGREIVVSGTGEDAERLLAATASAFVPGATWVHATPEAVAALGWLDGYAGDDALAYVCKDHGCQAPVSTPHDLLAALAED